MENMSDYLKQLEIHEDLEAEVIKKTKVHKVLKAIIKLDSIPKEVEYGFKKRSNDLLSKWGGALAAENEPTTATPAAEPATNGVKHDAEEKKPQPTTEEAPAETTEDPEKKDNASAEPPVSKTADQDGDVSMSEADKAVIENAPVAKAEANSGQKRAPEASTETETVAATNGSTTT